MLPKTGVYSLPDFRVVAFLKCLEDYGKRMGDEKRYSDMTLTQRNHKLICEKELEKQTRRMEHRKTIELQKIEGI